MWADMVLEKKLKIIHLYPNAAGRDSELVGLTWPLGKSNPTQWHTFANTFTPTLTRPCPINRIPALRRLSQNDWKLEVSLQSRTLSQINKNPKFKLTKFPVSKWILFWTNFVIINYIIMRNYCKFGIVIRDRYYVRDNRVRQWTKSGNFWR